MKEIFLKCGCSALATHNEDHNGLGKNHPSCPIHDCCEVATAPNLIGRKARCAYYGSPTRKNECDKCKTICNHERDSVLGLPFFSYQPTKQYDSFYCGCKGWD